MKTLREAKPGETVTVTKLNGTGAVKRRIMDMGITKGIPAVHSQGCSLGRSGRGHHPRLRTLVAQG